MLTLQDIDRSLNTRGYKDAHTMSLRLKEKNIVPDIIITSPAIRAISTALIFARNLNIPANNLMINEQLYHTNQNTYLKLISSASDTFSSLMIFAHNPIITQTANSLTKPFTDNIPTCGIACIQFDCEHWNEIEKKEGVLFFFDFPKN
jgi:phosphohistidine phosphatase